MKITTQESQAEQARRLAAKTQDQRMVNEVVSGTGMSPWEAQVVVEVIRDLKPQVIVTFNVKDFPPESVIPHDLDVVHPDDFLLDQLDLHPALVGRALTSLVRRYTRPTVTLPSVLTTLARAGVPVFAQEVRRHDFAATTKDD